MRGTAMSSTTPAFGVVLSPDARQPSKVLQRAILADALGLDLVGVPDHPYAPGALDSWTTIAAAAASTQHIRFFPDVANLPLRPPAMLAKASASLDLLTGGRIELGLGAGADPAMSAAMGAASGGPLGTVDALSEAIELIRLWWDGWIPSFPYAEPEHLPAMIGRIDDAALAVGRSPTDIRRLYNISGTFSRAGSAFLAGPASVWIEQLSQLAIDVGVDGFVLAPTGDVEDQMRRFALEVAPGVREAVAAVRASRGGAA